MVVTSNNISKVITENGKQVLAVYSPTGERLGGVILTPSTPVTTTTSTGSSTSTAQPSPEKLEWIKQQEAKGAILSPSLKAELKQAQPSISSFEAGNEVPVSPAVANKLGLISKQEQQEAETKGAVYITKASWAQETERPEETLANIKSGKVYAYIETNADISKLDPIDRVGTLIQRGNDVKFSTNPNEIPRNSIILTEKDFSIDNNRLMLHALPVWLEYKIKSEQNLQAMEKQGLVKQYENLPRWKKAIVGARLGLTDYVDTARLLVSKVTDNAYGNYNDILAEVLAKQARREKNPLGIIEAEIDAFTKGAGLVTIARPLAVGTVTAINKASQAVTEATQFVGGSAGLGTNLAGIMRGALIGVTTATAGLSVAIPIARKEYGVALGRGLILTGVILGGVSGIAEAKRMGYTFGVEPAKKIDIKPDKVYYKEAIEKQSGKTRIYGEVDLVDEDTGAKIHGEHISVKKNGVLKDYYKIPNQKTYITGKNGEVIEVEIKEQIIIDKTGDLAKIRTELYSGKNVKEFAVRRLQKETSLGYESDKAISSNMNSIDKSLKTVDELVTIKTDKSISQAVRQGTTEFEQYVEKAYATPTESIGKGVVISTEIEKPFTYFYLNKDVTSKITDLTDITKPVIRGTTGGTSTSTGSSLSATLKRLESIRNLQDKQITASINKANVGRIIPNLLTSVNAESILPPILQPRVSQVKEVEAQKKQPKIRSTNIYLPPIITNPNFVNDILDNATRQGQKQIQGTRQAQTPVQKFIQEIDLITTPATQQKTRTQVRTERIQPRIVTPETIEIGRPIRIVPPRPFFNVGLGVGSKDLDAYLRSIQHKLIEAMRLVI